MASKRPLSTPQMGQVCGQMAARSSRNFAAT